MSQPDWQERYDEIHREWELACEREAYRTQELTSAFEAIAAALEREKKLKGALRDVFALLEEGFLVRDVSRDSDPLWALNSIRFVMRLKAAYDLAEPKEGT